jgi:peroxiredoxin
MIGHTATDVSAEYIGGEGPRSVKEALGKVVVVDFWGTWCKPCQESFPEYAKIASDFRGDVVVLGIAIDDPEDMTKEKILSFARQAHADFPILWDKDGSTAALWGGARHLPVPSTFVIDRTGTVRHLHQGYTPFHASTIRREVKELLAEPTPPPALAAISVWAPPSAAPSCEVKPEHVARYRSDARSRCRDEACRTKVEREIACNLCVLASCCAEQKACSSEAFPPNSTGRTEAAVCHCRAEARQRGHADADARCGLANDVSRAEAACLATHCADVCANKESGGPP